MRKLMLSLALSLSLPCFAQIPVSQDGLTVSPPDVFDNYYLQQQLNSLRGQLEALQVLNSATITGHIGNAQGADARQFGVSFQGGGAATPALTTVSGAIPSTTTVTGTNPSVTTVSGTAPTVTSNGVSLAPPTPSVAPATTTSPTPVLGSQDTLAESIELAQRINALELMLDGSLNNKIDPRTGKARKVLTIGFPITFERPDASDYARRVKSVADVSVTLCSSSNGLSIMQVLPQERTYDVAGLVNHSASGTVGGIIGGVFSLGGGFLWSHQRYDLVRQQETVALRVPAGTCPNPAMSPRASFKWEIQPVLGSNNVRTGTQENFVQISLPSDGTTPPPGGEVILACVDATWRKIKKGGDQLGDPGLSSTSCFPVLNYDTTPQLENVSIRGIGNGNVWVTARAEAILPGTGVRIGAVTLPQASLTFSPDGTTVEFPAAAADIINAGGASLISRDGKSVALSNHGGADHNEHLTIPSIKVAAFSDSTDKLTLTYKLPLGNELPPEPCDPLPGQTLADPACESHDPWIVVIGGKAYGLPDAPFLSASEDFNTRTGTIELFLPSDVITSSSKVTLERLLWSAGFYTAEVSLNANRVSVVKVVSMTSAPGIHVSLLGANLQSAKLMYPQVPAGALSSIQSDFATLDLTDAQAKGVKQIVFCQVKSGSNTCDPESQPIFVDLPKSSAEEAKPGLTPGKSITLNKDTSVLIDGNSLDQILSVSYAGTRLNIRITPDKPPQLQVDLPASIYSQAGTYPLKVEYADKSVGVYALAVVASKSVVSN